MNGKIDADVKGDTALASRNSIIASTAGMGWVWVFVGGCGFFCVKTFESTSLTPLPSSLSAFKLLSVILLFVLTDKQQQQSSNIPGNTPTTVEQPERALHYTVDHHLAELFLPRTVHMTKSCTLRRSFLVVCSTTARFRSLRSTIGEWFMRVSTQKISWDLSGLTTTETESKPNVCYSLLSAIVFAFLQLCGSVLFFYRCIFIFSLQSSPRLVSCASQSINTHQVYTSPFEICFGPRRRSKWSISIHPRQISSRIVWNHYLMNCYSWSGRIWPHLIWSAHSICTQPSIRCHSFSIHSAFHHLRVQ